MKYIKSVGIKNFFSYGPQESVIDLTGSGLVNISGKNGVGKSTILEAMIFALKKLARENFAELAPTKISVLLEYSHPPLASRISAVEKMLKNKEKKYDI